MLPAALLPLSTVAACKPGYKECHGRWGSMAVILLPTAPPRRSASWMIKRQYASMSLVLESSEHIAVYAAKQYTHEARNGTSLSLGLRLVVWPCKSSSWSCRVILSARRSRILTNSPLRILFTSRYRMGSAASDKMRPNRGPGVKA